MAGYPDCDHRLAAAVAALVQATDKSQVPPLQPVLRVAAAATLRTGCGTQSHKLLSVGNLHPPCDPCDHPPTRPPRVS